MKILQPAGWPRPKGYSNGISARGRMIFWPGLYCSSMCAHQPEVRLMAKIGVYNCIDMPIS